MNHSNKLTHLAVIMDGNRRWARKRGLAVLLGHKEALNNTIEPLVEKCAKSGISYITLWAFSCENWKRDEKEVAGMLSLFRDGMKSFGKRMIQKGVNIKVIGDLSRFPEDIQKSVKELCGASENNTAITLIVALNYGGRDEIVRAIHKMKKENKSFEKCLDTAGIPDPDLIIRTGGEKRLSGFLPWQSVYSELYFTEVLFPDFSVEELDKALADYALRSRRFGR